MKGRSELIGILRTEAENNFLKMKFKEPITIIGAGAVGRSIALALFSGGAKIAGIYSLGGVTARKAARKIGIKIFGTIDSAKAPEGIVIIAVPDGKLPAVSRMLSQERRSFKGSVILHTSGALSSDELQALRKKGASVASFHPLQTFPSSKATSFKEIWIAVEGDRIALQVCAQLAKILHAHTFIIPKEAKVLYHTAAVFASNYLVTLLSAAEQIAGRIKVPKKNIWKIYQPIIQQTLRNVIASTPAKALTGPIARGDINTVTKHLQALADNKLNHLVPLYSVLGIETVRLAKKKK